jgi:hypothetical protein
MAKHQIFWLTLSLLILTVVLHFRLSEPYSINVDGAFHLQCAQQLLAGKLPYVGVFDNNPPLSMYLHMIPCLLANAIGAHAITCFNVVIWLLAVCSLLWCWSILTRSARLISATEWGLLLVVMSLVTFTVGADYGQREHLFVLCTLPLLMVRWMRWQGTVQQQGVNSLVAPTIGRVERFAIGMLAGVGLLLKPHFLLPLIGAELAWIVSKRKLKPLGAAEFGGCLAASVLYAIHFALWPASVQESFFHNIVPLVIHGYGAYDSGLVDIIRMYLPEFYGGIWYGMPYFIPMFALTLAGIAILLRTKSSFLVPLIVYTLGGYLAFVLQHKGWSNHTIPMLTGCFLLSALELAVVVDFRALNKRFFSSSCSVLGLLIILVGAGCRNEAPLYEDPELLNDLTTYTQPGDKVLVLASVLYPAYPLLTQLNLQPASRYLHLFPLPMLEYWKARTSNPHEKKRLEKEENQVLVNVHTDIDVNKPKLIAIETKALDRGDRNFTISTYLDQHHFADNNLKNYCFVRDAGFYLLYRRIVD